VEGENKQHPKGKLRHDLLCKTENKLHEKKKKKKKKKTKVGYRNIRQAYQ
jgi:hypothetical protein